MKLIDLATEDAFIAMINKTKRIKIANFDGENVSIVTVHMYV